MSWQGPPCLLCYARSNFYWILSFFFFFSPQGSPRSQICTQEEKFAVLLQDMFPLLKAEQREDGEVCFLFSPVHRLTLCHVPNFCIHLACYIQRHMCSSHQAVDAAHRARAVPQPNSSVERLAWVHFQQPKRSILLVCKSNSFILGLGVN